jgi:plastocyanin
VNIAFTASGAPHSFTIDGLADTGVVAAGGTGSASFTPAAAGTLSFYCRVHGASVMGGQITVTP